MILPVRAKTSGIFTVLLLLASVFVMGCGSQPTLTLEQIDDLKTQAFKLFQDNKYKEATPLIEKAVQAGEKVYPKNSDELANLYTGLGRSLQGDKRYIDAILFLEKATVIYKALPDKKPELARALGHLGVCLAQNGNDDLALKAMFESVAAYTDAGMESSIECLGAIVSLSAVGIKNKKYKESEDVMQMALKVCRSDPEVPPGIYVNVLNNIGEINYLRQDFETALKYYQEAFDMAEKKLGERPELVAVYRKNVESAKGKVKK